MKTPSCFFLPMVLVFVVLVVPVQADVDTPNRGHYVPADLTLKIHPFVEHHRFGGRFYRGQLMTKTDTGWRVSIQFNNTIRRRTIPTENVFLTESWRQPGQSVLIKESSFDGTPTYLITDINRIGRYVLLVALSLLLCLIVGGWITARSLLGVFSGVLFLVFYALPAVLSGGSIPLYIGLFYLITTILILPGSLGFNRTSLAAVLAALSSGILAFGLLYCLAHAMALTGLRNSSIQVLEYAVRYFPELTDPFSILNLLLGGILIGSLGVILDVCVDVTSSTAEIARARPDLNLTEQLNRTLTVTSRLIGTMTNTLLLAYIGTDMFLILTVYLLPSPGWVLLNKDFVALEVLRAFGGTLGFLTAAPLSILFYRLLNPAGETSSPAVPDP